MIVQRIDYAHAAAGARPPRDGGGGGTALAARWAVDPLDPDADVDEVVVTSTRRLLRLAVAATEIGARFAREGLREDPAAWMMAPRAMFDGRPPVEACQELDGFRRNVLLHGLQLGLDADPADLDDLLADEEEEGASDRVIPIAGRADHASRGTREATRLLTCWVDVMDDGDVLFAFCALVTDRPADLVERVVGRYGRMAAAEARYDVGFDGTTALATAMISDAMADTLALAASDPGSPLARGLDVVVEQRFAA